MFPTNLFFIFFHLNSSARSYRTTICLFALSLTLSPSLFQFWNLKIAILNILAIRIDYYRFSPQPFSIINGFRAHVKFRLVVVQRVQNSETYRSLNNDNYFFRHVRVVLSASTVQFNVRPPTIIVIIIFSSRLVVHNSILSGSINKYVRDFSRQQPTFSTWPSWPFDAQHFTGHILSHRLDSENVHSVN